MEYFQGADSNQVIDLITFLIDALRKDF